MEGIPLRFWVSVLPLLLVGYYLFVTDATVSSKTILAVLFGVSVVVVFVFPAVWLWAFLLQVAVGIYIAYYLTLRKQ